MKKILLILLCLPMIGFGQSTTILDANFEQALINLGYDTGTPNGSVPTSNINTVDELFIFNQNISDLTGIEDFTALEYLYCDNNNLTFLDLSSNLLLEEVDCSNNNLTSLVLGSNTPLGEVVCSYNQIITLDLSNCPNLDWFECENNALTSLNFRNGNNSAAWVFKVSNNTDLTCIDVDDASWSTANWTFASGNIDPQHYFHGVLESGWVDVGSLSIAAPGASYIRDFIIDTDDIMYVIGGANLSTLRYDPNGTGNWVDIGGLAHKIAVDNNNDLHKVSLDKFYYDPTSPYIYSQTKAALKLMKYNGSGWTLTSVDTIHSDYWNYDFFGAIEIEDFIIDASGNSYVSLMVNDPDVDIMFDYARIHIKKYDGVWSDLDTTGILKHHHQYFSLGTNWYKQFNMKTTLAINPNTGNLLIAGQQGACSQFFPPWYGNVTLTSNVVKEYNGVNWNLLGNAIPIVQLTPGGSRAGGAFLETNMNGDIISAFTNDHSGFSNPYESDTVTVYKYNAASNSWDNLIGGNPNIEMWYVNSLSMDINSSGEPCFVFSGESYSPYTAYPAKGMQMAVQYNNSSNQWETVASPIGANSIGYVEDWQLPIIRFNSDNKPFINYYRDLISVENTITYQNADSSFCNNNSTIIEENNTNTTNKELLKVTDLLGRETKGKKNEVLFYIYEDGTVEKKIIIE
jgi:hypothetical protein